MLPASSVAPLLLPNTIKAMSSLTPNFINSIMHVMDPALDPSLVENTPRLLDVLNRSDRLSRLLLRRDSRGYTLLHIAAEKNQPESLKCLLIKEGTIQCYNKMI